MEPTQLVAAGLFLGLSSGVTPGPTTTLVVSETMRHGTPAGVKVAIAPLLTDAPIIVVAMLVLQPLSSLDGVLGWIYIAGALVLCFLGITTLRTDPEPVRWREGRSGAITRGILANAINPHPYVFWTLVGGPLLLLAWRRSAPAAAGFLAAFYVSMVGSKILLAWVVHRSRTFVAGRGYLAIVRGLGALLLLFAMGFLVEGLQLLCR